LYVYDEQEGFFKVGTGKNYTMVGKVYKHNIKKFGEKGTICYLLGRLLYRSKEIAPKPLVEIDTETLELK
jgi:hypothetical protein